MTKPPLILVADDDTHIVNVLAVKLKSAGFGVVCAHDGGEALHTAPSRTPGLVVTDYPMPALTGHEPCKELLVNEHTLNTPVIPLTGRSHSLRGNMACTTNVRAMIGKPFSPREVLNKVYELLNLTPGEGVARAS